MEISYDESSDVLYIKLEESEKAETVHTEDDVLVRKNADTGEIVGYSILGFKERDSVKLPENAEAAA